MSTLNEDRKLKIFDIYLNEKRIDTIYYYCSIAPSEVKESLVEHDGYNPQIEVRIRRE